MAAMVRDKPGGSRGEDQRTERIVERFLVDRKVPGTVARKVAREARKALYSTPSWYASTNGRLLVHIWLFRALVEGGHRPGAAELIADLLSELSAA